MKLFAVGLSYKTAPVEVREQIAVTPGKLRCRSCRLKIAGELSEVVLLSTCNRVEIYGVTPGLNGRLDSLFSLLTDSAVDLRPHLYAHEGADAVRHLFSVASGLDSMVLGETEITGQVKQAYQTAQEAKLTGKILNRLFQTALQTAKEIRTRTNIGRGATSVGSVAVELAEKIFAADLARHNVMIIGAGKMGEACLRHLTKKGARSVMVSNRSFERACELATDFGGRAIRFDDCLNALGEADIVISSTGAPQDIDPEVQFINNVYLYNIDHLEEIVRENVRQRQQELTRCEAIIQERTAALWTRLAPSPTESQDNRVRPQPAWVLFGTELAR